MRHIFIAFKIDSFFSKTSLILEIFYDIFNTLPIVSRNKTNIVNILLFYGYEYFRSGTNR